MGSEVNSGHLLELERKRTMEEVNWRFQQLPEEGAGAGTATAFSIELRE